MMHKLSQVKRAFVHVSHIGFNYRRKSRPEAFKAATTKNSVATNPESDSSEGVSFCTARSDVDSSEDFVSVKSNLDLEYYIEDVEPPHLNALCQIGDEKGYRADIRSAKFDPCWICSKLTLRLRPTQVWCEQCNFKFGNQLNLLLHYIHNPTHEYCTRCQCIVSGDMTIARHVDESDTHWICYDERCMLPEGKHPDFENLKWLQNHCVENHSESYCSKCRVLFPSAQDLLHHQITSSEHYMCQYEQCRKEFESKILLVTHLRETLLHWTCWNCMEGFRSPEERKLHLQLSKRCNSLLYEDSSYAEPFYGYCPACASEFMENSEILKHLESKDCLLRTKPIQEMIKNDATSKLSSKTSYLDQFAVLENRTHVRNTNHKRKLGGSLPNLNLPQLRIISSNRDEDTKKATHDIYRCPKDGCRSTFQSLWDACRHVESHSDIAARRIFNDLAMFVASKIRKVEVTRATTRRKKVARTNPRKKLQKVRR